ncbi:NAD-dependent formate dehydrogenase [Gordonia iterans]
MAKILCVLYPDPMTGFPPVYARDSLPSLGDYPTASPSPTPKNIDFTPGQLLGCVSGELGLRSYLEAEGHELVVTSDKDGPDSVFEKELPNADVVISQPFWPAYLDAERIAKAPKLKLALTAGIGSDHVDLDAATRPTSPSRRSPTVPAAYDLEGFDVGVIAAGRIGQAVLRRLAPFDVNLHYFDTRSLPEELEKELNLTYHPNVLSLVSSVDIVDIHAPLHPQTYHMFDANLINSMRRGSYIVNTARAEIMVRDDVVDALRSGQLAGYAGDVWFPQPPAPDHPWRTMPHEAMTPHISGTTLSAQARYAAGTREILENFFAGAPIRDEYLIVEGGALAGTGAKSYTADGKASPGARA